MTVQGIRWPHMYLSMCDASVPPKLGPRPRYRDWNSFRSLGVRLQTCVRKAYRKQELKLLGLVDLRKARAVLLLTFSRWGKDLEGSPTVVLLGGRSFTG